MFIYLCTVVAVMAAPGADLEGVKMQTIADGEPQATSVRSDDVGESGPVCPADESLPALFEDDENDSSVASTESSAASVDPTVADPRELQGIVCCAGAGGCGVFPRDCPGGLDPVSCPCPPAY